MDDKALNLDHEYERLHNILKRLCNELVFLADPDIESKMICTLDCCVGNTLPNLFDYLLLDKVELTEVILGIKGLKLLVQLKVAHHWAVYSEADGFSKEPDWIEFQSLVRQNLDYIESQVKLHKEKSSLVQKYPIEYSEDFIQNCVKPIAQQKFSDTFFMRCEFILNDPDEYAEITWSLFNKLKILYTLLQSAYLGELETSYDLNRKGLWYYERLDYSALPSLEEKIFKMDPRIARCAQLIVDEFEKTQQK